MPAQASVCYGARQLHRPRHASSHTARQPHSPPSYDLMIYVRYDETCALFVPQNNIKELWALLHFLHPEKFPDW